MPSEPQRYATRQIAAQMLFIKNGYQEIRRGKVGSFEVIDFKKALSLWERAQYRGALRGNPFRQGDRGMCPRYSDFLFPLSLLGRGGQGERYDLTST